MRAGLHQAINELWYDEQRRYRPLALLLLPLSWICRALIWLRRRCLSGRALPIAGVKVVVVGNITVGGAGKTPLILWLAERLLERGYRVGIVSRGYGRRHPEPQQPLLVTDSHSPEDVSDEPFLMASRRLCPVAVCSDRRAAVELLHKVEACDLVLSDDGLQHYR